MLDGGKQMLVLIGDHGTSASEMKGRMKGLHGSNRRERREGALGGHWHGMEAPEGSGRGDVDG